MTDIRDKQTFANPLALKQLFGNNGFKKLQEVFNPCCDISSLSSFCTKVKECLGISDTGDTTLFLNQRGEWALVSGSGVSEPNTQVVFGTGSGVTSDSKFTYTVAGFNSPILRVLNNLNYTGDVLTNRVVVYGTDGTQSYISRATGGSTPNNFFLPNNNGNSGDVLRTDGSGNLSWTANSGAAGWLLTGNTGITSGTNFLGTTDTNNLVLKVNNTIAGLIGDFNVNRNTVFGFSAMLNVVVNGNDPALDFNTAIGNIALKSITSGSNNTALGYAALRDLVLGSGNTAIGTSAMYGRTGGSNNTAVGYGAATLAEGDNNTVVGKFAAITLRAGSNNTVIGKDADVATATTSDGIALGNGAIASSNEFAISPSATSVNFTNSGIRLRGEIQVYGASYALGDNVHYFALSGGTGAVTVDIASIRVNQSVVISDLDGISSTSNITIDSGAGHTIRSQIGAAQTLVLNQNGGSYTIYRVSTTKFMVI